MFFKFPGEDENEDEEGEDKAEEREEADVLGMAAFRAVYSE